MKSPDTADGERVERIRKLRSLTGLGLNETMRLDERIMQEGVYALQTAQPAVRPCERCGGLGTYGKNTDDFICDCPIGQALKKPQPTAEVAVFDIAEAAEIILEVADSINDAINYGHDIFGSKTVDPLMRAYGLLTVKE